jgi:hypothetical protein
MTRFYDPTIHDAILERLHIEWRLDDVEISHRMQIPVCVIRTNRRRLNLPPNPRLTKPYAMPQEENRPAPPVKPNPIHVALSHLAGRLEEKPSGYWLDGCPVNLTSIMRETNRIRASKGMEQLTANAEWRVEPCPA